MCASCVRQETIDVCIDNMPVDVKPSAMDYSFSHVWSAEKNGWKRKFIQQNHSPCCIFSAMADVSAPFAKNALTGQLSLVDWSHMNATGWPCVCVSRARLDHNLQVGCLRTGMGQSGEVFNDLIDFLKAECAPVGFIGENASRPYSAVDLQFVFGLESCCQSALLG